MKRYSNENEYLVERLQNAVAKGYNFDMDENFIEIAINNLEPYILDNFSNTPIFEYHEYLKNISYNFHSFQVDFDFGYNTMKEITANDKILFEVEIINDKTHFTAVDYYTALHSNKDIIFVYCKHIVDVECNVVWLYDYINLD